MNIAMLESDLARSKADTLALYRSTAKTAHAENRPFTDEETAIVNAKKAEGVAIEQTIARLRADAGMLAEIERLASGATAVEDGRDHGRRGAQSWGERFTASDAMQFIRAGGHRSSASWRTPSVELPWYRGSGGLINLRAATLTEGAGSGAAWVLPDHQAGVVTPLPPAYLVSELFAQGTTDSNLISYMRETAWVNAAAPVLEGGLKPESTLTFEAANDPVRKIAHYLPVTEELLEDAPAVSSYIDARLRMGVLAAEQNQLINGDGTAPNLSGILDRAGLAPDIARDTTAPVQTNADVFLEQTLAIFAASGLMPDGYVINPMNWTRIVLAKDATGAYFTGGPFSPIQSPYMWGLPVALSPAIAIGLGLVGAFKSGAQIFRKGGVRVEASNSHADFFIKNLVAIRAEERLALAVYRPAAFGTVSALE